MDGDVTRLSPEANRECDTFRDSFILDQNRVIDEMQPDAARGLPLIKVSRNRFPTCRCKYWTARP
jgi:hypothetical protein